MCTLAIAPDRKGGFRLVSNRDEGLSRESSTLPQCLRIRERRVIMPIDPQGGGSWIGLSDEGRAACLLNGAREAHESKGPYARSRGQILRESFEWEDVEAFAEQIPLARIGEKELDVEPFTLVLLGTDPQPWLFVLRWDGREREFEYPNPERSHVFSAAKLYSPEVIRQTEERFEGFLKNASDPPSLEGLKSFDAGERYRLKMEKAGETPIEGLDTLSTTALSFNSEGGRMELQDHREELLSVTSWSHP